jgi:hypothetical protein
MRHVQLGPRMRAVRATGLALLLLAPLLFAVAATAAGGNPNVVRDAVYDGAYADSQND